MKTEQISFNTRRARSEFVAKRFADVINGNVLDVGCYEAPLRELLCSCNYFGIDIAGNPDMKINIDTVDGLPFQNSSKDCVLCIEVLEHLENFHSIFDELMRISNRYILISLPNSWRDARVPLERGCGTFAHYGLPIEKPTDRHRWFFNHTQAHDFLLEKAGRHGLKVIEMFATEPKRPMLLRWLRRICYPGDKYMNRYSQTIWCVLQKSHNHT
ncbi:MAG: methyltransferase domain-containing protein [Rhodocyclaceae bacterium]|nr:methyltransferase domain-containing protein [Rhodocyclaceae bacterium]